MTPELALADDQHRIERQELARIESEEDEVNWFCEGVDDAVQHRLPVYNNAEYLEGYVTGTKALATDADGIIMRHAHHGCDREYPESGEF